MRRFRRWVALTAVACLLPLLARLLGNGLASVGGCSPPVGAMTPCATGGRGLAQVVGWLHGLDGLMPVTLSIAAAALVFLSLAEAARLMGRARQADKAEPDGRE